MRLSQTTATTLRTLAGITVFASAEAARAAPFYTGGDISLSPFLESRGAIYREEGSAKPVEQILVDHGANLFRLRLFVNPSLNYDSPSNRGAIQNLQSVIAHAQRLQPTGAKFMLALHFSDTWADPAHQTIPAAWSGQSLAQLTQTVKTYTQNTLAAFKNAGVMPDIVQLGNETTAGMLWPRGQLNFNGTTAQLNASWANYGQLMNAAISGVRQMQMPGEKIDVAVTIAPGEEWYNNSVGGLPRWFVDNFQTHGGVTDFDILGIDSYPTTRAELDGLINNLNDVANRYDRKVMVMETSYPWNHSLDGTAADQYSTSTEPYATTIAGQKAYLLELRDAVRALPHQRGAGVLWWYPEAVPTPNTYVWKGGALGTFDAQGNALPVLDVMNLADLDVDGDLDAADLAILFASAGYTTRNDINHDGSVITAINKTDSDVDSWVRIFKRTEYGDADLNGRVDFDDLLSLAQHYGDAGDWTVGDFDGSRFVDFADLLLLAQHYGFGTETDVSFEADFAVAFAPEPATFAWIALPAAMKRRRSGASRN